MHFKKESKRSTGTLGLQLIENVEEIYGISLGNYFFSFRYLMLPIKVNYLASDILSSFLSSVGGYKILF